MTVKHLGTNFTRMSKTSLKKTYRITTKGNKTGLEQMETKPCFWIEKFNIIKILFLPKLICTFNEIKIKE